MPSDEMPIMGARIGTRLDFTVPFEMLNEEWAQRNHDQTLSRLRERGGLSPCEALAIVEQRPWRRMSDIDAESLLRFRVEKWLRERGTK